LGANYAPCIVPQLQAASRGFQQNLWLFGEEEYVTEVGTMNLFLAMVHKQSGQKELVTAPLDGTILEGVTRDSVLALARERLTPEGWTISERKVRMSEVVEASAEGRLLEVFGSGTAAVVSPVRKISYKGQLLDCGLKENEEAGDIAKRMKDWIEGIQYGAEEHKWRYAFPLFSTLCCWNFYLVVGFTNGLPVILSSKFPCITWNALCISSYQQHLIAFINVLFYWRYICFC
jgi:branched-chain amino acid aminotransferase